MPRFPTAPPKRAAEIPPSPIDIMVIHQGLVTFAEIVRRRQVARARHLARHPVTAATGGRGLARFAK